MQKQRWSIILIGQFAFLSTSSGHYVKKFRGVQEKILNTSNLFHLLKMCSFSEPVYWVVDWTLTGP